MEAVRGAVVRSGNGRGHRYELAEPIASGGMAVIRRGFDRWAQRDIAHKRLRVDRELARPRLSALFQREYDTLARLEHPNIVEVYDFGFDEQGPYYAMELLSGADLSKISPLPYPEACRILRDVASALALVHARRFVHRDVSPNNVRLTSDGVAKLIDFGALTPFGRPGEIAGTPQFIAPECLEDVDLDQRADLYSLGALAYWTLTGRSAVSANSIDRLQDAWRVPVVPASSHVQGIPHALEELIASLMSHDRTQRPSSAAEVIERLTNIADLPPERSERKVAYSYLKHPPLAGRSKAVETLRGALARALVGEGGVVIVEAMAGLGRSALLEQFGIDAQIRGASVLRAEGSSAGGSLGVARRLTQLGARIYPDLEGTEAFALLQLEAGKLEAARHPMEAMERSTLAAGRLRKLLLQLSERGPLVIVLDDADSADAESLGLLASMADELSQHPILLLLSVRGAGDASIAHAYAKLAERARKVVLQNLESAQVVELVQGMFGAVPNAHRVALWLHHETGGNPAQCVDLLRLMLQQGSIRYTRGTFSLPYDIDPSVARDRRSNTLLTRLSGLSVVALQLVELLSLHRGALSSAQLAEATALDPRQTLLLIEQLVHRGVAFFVADRVSLRGESLRAVVEQTIDPERKRLLHGALATIVSTADDGALSGELDRAWHLFRSGEAGELAATQLMMHLLAVHRHDVSMTVASVPLLEAALEVQQRRGGTDLHCAPLLAALSVTGYYGNLEAQRKYLRRALLALSAQSGLLLARKLTPYLGTFISLWIGLSVATVCAPFLPGRFGRLSIKRRIEDLLTAASCGVAAAATVFDLELADEVCVAVAPLAGFSSGFAPRLALQFCLTTAQLPRLNLKRAHDSYASLLHKLRKKIFMMDERLRVQLRLGTMHGKAHTEVDQSNGESLALAEELERGSPFFAPHAETLRVVYHAMRGERDLAELHRARAETLALRGGTSWTAATVLALRALEPAVITRDISSVERSLTELDRLAKLEPALERYCELARARLCLLRGQAQEAHDLLAPLLRDNRPHLSWRTLRLSLAEALLELGRFADAEQTCLRALEGLHDDQLHFSSVLRMPLLQLARAYTGLGKLEQARELLAVVALDAAGRGSPLEEGAVQRELALVALAARDSAAFERHCSAMVEHWQRTQYPALVRQREELWARGVALGLCERPAISPASSLESDGLEGDTVVESRSSSRVPPPPKRD